MAAGRHLGKFRMTISQDSIYYETYGHVTDDVTCRKWRLFKERNPRSAHTSSPTGLFFIKNVFLQFSCPLKAFIYVCVELVRGSYFNVLLFKRNIDV